MSNVKFKHATKGHQITEGIIETAVCFMICQLAASKRGVLAEVRSEVSLKLA